MCRSIRTLHNFEPPATADEVEAAALQYVRKIAGMRQPAAVNRDAFEDAVREITEATHRLVQSLVPTGQAKTREAEALKAKARWAQREGGSTAGG